MKIGLLLGSQNRIPIHIYNSLVFFCTKNSHQIFLVVSPGNSVKKKKSILFQLLEKIEKKLARSTYYDLEVHFPKLDNIDDLDLLIDWSADLNNYVKSSNIVPTIRILANNQYVDHDFSLLVDVFKRREIRLDVYVNDYLIESFCNKSAKTFSRTKDIMIQKSAQILIRTLYLFTVKDKLDLVKELCIVERSSKLKVNNTLACFYLILIFIRNFKNHLFSRNTVERSFWDLYIADDYSIKEIVDNKSEFTLIKHDSSRFWADPFLFEFNKDIYILIEEFIYEKGRGEIAILKRNISNGEFDYQGVIFQKDYHLSYPFIFSIGDVPYMVPESGSVYKADLYKCDAFPNKWSLQRNLLNGFNFADTTILFLDDVYWIFTSASKDGFQQNEQLLLFYTDNLLEGEIFEHPQNPIVVGSTRSRMAGTFIFESGVLYRPSQDCSSIYGGAISLMKVERLTKIEYKESLISKINPFEGYKGLHTISKLKNYTIIDVY